MKTIICGGRNKRISTFWWDHMTKDYGFLITEVVSGNALGIDSDGERWAEERAIPTVIFPVNDSEWRKFGKLAGPMRNERMAKYADAIIVFPGGRGTANMMKLAKQYELKFLLVVTEQ